MAMCSFLRRNVKAVIFPSPIAGLGGFIAHVSGWLLGSINRLCLRTDVFKPVKQTALVYMEMIAEGKSTRVRLLRGRD